MGYERQIAVDNDKYTFFVPDGDYKIHILRHGEPWLVLEQGSNAVWALMNELIEAAKLVAAIEEWRRADYDLGVIGLIIAHDNYRQELGQEPFKP